MTDVGFHIPGDPIKPDHRLVGYIMCAQVMDPEGAMYYASRSFNVDTVLKLGMAEMLRLLYGEDIIASETRPPEDS